MSANPAATTATRGNILSVFSILLIFNFIVAYDSTALSTALPTISKDLRATSVEAFWTGTSFTLASTIAQPLTAAAAAAFGRRPISLLTVLLFTVGGIVCGIAHHVSVLLLGRTLQGAGGGGMITLCYLYMVDVLDLKRRHQALSVMSLTWLIAPALGPVLSGAFTERATWRWIFWFNMPFCGIAFFIIIFFLQTPYKPPFTGLQRLKRIDWIGMFLFTVSLTLFLLSISWGGIMFAWSSAATVAPLVIGIVGIIAWAVYSVKIPEYPILPLRVIDEYTVVITHLGNLVHGLVMFAALYYMPLYFQVVLGYSPIISGVALLSSSLWGGPFSAIVGPVLTKYGYMKVITISAWTLFALGSGLRVLYEPSTSVATWICLTIPFGIGMGAVYPALALTSQAACEVSNRSPAEILKYKAAAATLNPFFRALGQTLGIVVGQSAFTNELKKRLGANIASEAASQDQTFQSLPKNIAERIFVVQQFNDSLHAVWWTTFALAAMMIVLSLFIRDVRLSKPDANGSGPAASIEKRPPTEEEADRSVSSTTLGDNSLHGVKVVDDDGLDMPAVEAKRESFIDHREKNIV